MDTFSLDHLSDTQFEEFCYDLLGELGFVNLDWRKGTGLDSSPSDRGRDIECEIKVKDTVDGSVRLEKWFVQCKQYKRGVPPKKLDDTIAPSQSRKRRFSGYSCRRYSTKIIVHFPFAASLGITCTVPVHGSMAP